MTPAAPNSSSAFRPQVEDLECRVVPASGLDPDFFDNLQFQAVSQAQSREESTVRVITGIYQEGTQNATNEYNAYEAEKAAYQRGLADAVKGLVAQFQNGQKQVAEYERQMQERYKKDTDDLGAKAQAALDAPAPGATPQAVEQRNQMILAWTAQQYEGLTKSVTAQYNEVQLQFKFLERDVQAKYAKFIAIVDAKFAEMNRAQANLLDAYSRFESDLVAEYTRQVKQIRDDLLIQLSAIQQLYANQTQIVTTSPQTFGGGGGGQTITVDESQPKGH